MEELLAIHPDSDVLALLAMDTDKLNETMAACRILYGGVKTDNKGALRNADRKTRCARLCTIRAILAARARFAAMTDEERAAIVVEEEE